MKAKPHPHPHTHTCRELMKMYVVKETGGVQGSNVNVCWTGGGQTVVLIDLGPSLFTYLDPSEAVSKQQLLVKTLKAAVDKKAKQES